MKIESKKGFDINAYDSEIRMSSRSFVGHPVYIDLDQPIEEVHIEGWVSKLILDPHHLEDLYHFVDNNWGVLEEVVMRRLDV